MPRRPKNAPPSSRRNLTDAEAVEVYKNRAALSDTILARKYAVSTRAVFNVRHHHSHCVATAPHWSREQREAYFAAPRKVSPRTTLDAAAAVEIYHLVALHSAAAVAARYRVSPKAVRDIWNGLSWKRATFQYWLPARQDEERAAHALTAQTNPAAAAPAPVPPPSPTPSAVTLVLSVSYGSCAGPAPVAHNTPTAHAAIALTTCW